MTGPVQPSVLLRNFDPGKVKLSGKSHPFRRTRHTFACRTYTLRSRNGQPISAFKIYSFISSSSTGSSIGSGQVHMFLVRYDDTTRTAPLPTQKSQLWERQSMKSGAYKSIGDSPHTGCDFSSFPTVQLLAAVEGRMKIYQTSKVQIEELPRPTLFKCPRSWRSADDVHIA